MYASISNVIRVASLASAVFIITPLADSNFAGEERIDVQKTEIGETSKQYLSEYSNCRFTINTSTLSKPKRILLDLDVTGPCDEPSSVQLNIFRSMLKYATEDQGEFGKFDDVGLPKIDFAKDFIAHIARSAYSSVLWKNETFGKSAGANVNSETFDLLNESSGYSQFVALLQEFGIAIELVSVEKAFLTTVSDLTLRKAKPSDLSDLPGGFLVPGTANPRFKVVPKPMK